MPYTDEVREALDRAEAAHAHYLSIPSWRFVSKARAARKWANLVEKVQQAEQKLWQANHPTGGEP